MTKCPGCQATLPDGAFQCQFCGTQLGAGPPPVIPGRAVNQRSSAMPGAPKWAVPAYNVIAAWWMLNGLWDILRVTLFSGKDDGGIFAIISAVIGGVTALVGLGLLLRVDAVRGIVNVLCFIQILDGIWSLIIGLFMTGILGVFGAIGMILSIIQIALACLMIYLIGETDTRAPNF